jgi:mono/diheme cytochrome c family protein
MDQEALMPKAFRILSALLLLSFCTLAEDTKAPATPETPAPIPADAIKQVNPVKASPESLAAARKWYGYDCAMCHGKDGKGKGDVGVDMKLTLADFTDADSLKDKTDGELFYVIKNGRGQMPQEGDRLKGNELWNMVNYVRAFAKHKPAGDEKAAQ